jgi:WD40 repeat protein/serine/threonine protein kinase
MTTPAPDIDWARAKAVLGEVLDAAPEMRDAELERRCGSDEALRNAVARLLAALDDSDDFLGAPDDARPESAPPEPTRIGPYELHEILGEGGFGVVFRATQCEPVVREVAIKLLKPGLGTSTIVQRFEAERHVLARMEHPGIAKLLDAGTTADGRSYVVMELVRGPSIVEYCRDRNLPARHRVALVARVCRAIHHAHQRAVIHRDIKPSNILVTEVDGRPDPRIIDFGIAKVLSDAQQEDHTRAGDVLGTPRYMSPEQISGGVTDIRVDVYALGVVLCEALTGAVPRSGESMSSRPLRETPAERPSRLVVPDAPAAAVAGGADLRRTLRGDLDRIVMQCVEWEPDNRYDSAAALADELDRYLRGEPILAAGPSVLYRTGKFLRRNLLATAVVAAAMLSLVLGTVTAIIYARAEKHAEDLRRVDYFHSIALAEHALDSSRTDELQRLLARCPSDLCGWEWRYLARRVDESVATLQTAPYVGAALSPDGRLFANGIRGRAVEIWDVPRRERLVRHSIGAGYVESLSFSPDGELLAVGTRADEPSYVLNVRTGEPVLEIPATEQVKAVLMHPDGRRLVTGSAHGVLAVRALDTGDALQTLTDTGQWVTALGLSPDGTILAAGRNDGTIETWNLVTGDGEYRIEGAHTARVSGVVFSADGASLHTSGWDAAVKTWDRSGRQTDVRRIEGGLVRRIALSPDGAVLAVVTPMSVELRDAVEGTLRRRRLGQIDGFGVAFPPATSTGGQMVTWSEDAVKIWDLDERRGAFVLGRHQTLAGDVATSSDDRWVASVARDGDLVVWDVATGASVARWNGGSSRIYQLTFNPKGDRLAGACHDGTVRVWSVPGGALERELRCNDDGPAFDVQWTDDEVILAATGDGVLSAWSCRDGARRWAVHTGQAALLSMVCDPTASRVATGGFDGTISIWSLDPPKKLRVIPAHERPIGGLAWSPDGTILASGGNDHVVRLWDPEDGSLRSELLGHEGLITGVAFSADGTRLATSAWEGEIRLWDTASGACVLRLRGHVGVVVDVAFTADGERLVSAGHDGTVRVWEAPAVK